MILYQGIRRRGSVEEREGVSWLGGGATVLVIITVLMLLVMF